MQKILVIDDERGIRESLTLILQMEGYGVDSAEDARAAIDLIASGKLYDFIICDIKLPGMSGIEFLQQPECRDIDSIVIMISAYGSIESSIEAIKRGAADYINKPINSEELILRMHMARERHRLRAANSYLRKELGTENTFTDIVHSSRAIDEVIELSSKASRFKTTVLITGESGTGKELVAKAIHNQSDRKDANFVAVNCAAIPEPLMESELFGYAKGAFTGANSSKRGLIEEAHGGTLFLDEIGEFPQVLQPKLLRVLQEEEIRRLGDNKLINIDVRVITATSRDLRQDVTSGRFRDDLFYRLNVFPIFIPPLRERKEDIPLLVGHFIDKYRRQINPRIRHVSPEAMAELTRYEWPGNVRELENIIERAMILSDSDIIQKVEPAGSRPPNSTELQGLLNNFSFDEAKQMVENAFIDRALSETGGNRTRAAKTLGISRRSLLYKLKQKEES
ncbi:MAG: sigma-54 dependent transcriptional regulator [Deltaproteobacteria bacterium]